MTAKEARKLADLKRNDYCYDSWLYTTIEGHASKGQVKCIFYPEVGVLDLIVKKLTENGYTVKEDWEGEKIPRIIVGW